MPPAPKRFKKALGERLRTARNSMGLTTAKVCDKLVINSTYLYDLEAGRQSPGSYHLYLLCGLYKVSADWVLTGRWKG